MPFLCVLEKPNSDNVANTAVDKVRLADLLCPYVGDINCVSVTGGVLYLSSLASEVDECFSGTEITTVNIPKQTKHNPQTSWLTISIDDTGIHFQTDPLGTFPLWYVEENNRLIITSEVKSLMSLADEVNLSFDTSRLSEGPKRPANFSPYSAIKRVRPGAGVSISRELRITEQDGLPLTYAPSAIFSSIEESKESLALALLESASAIGQGEGQWGSFLSGGIDSSTATVLMQRLKPALQTYTLGTKYGNEYVDSASLANYLETTHGEVFACEQQAVAHFERAVFCNETIDGLTGETLAQLSILTEAAAKNVKHIVTGYGADLLFGSMLRHELYMEVTGVNDLQSLIERTCWTGEFSPFYAWSLGVEVHHLFWDPALMNCAFRIPDSANFSGETQKVALRELAVENGFMQKDHAFRKKQALTDGTQFNRVLSTAFGLSDDYSYDQKSALCISMLNKLFGSIN